MVAFGGRARVIDDAPKASRVNAPAGREGVAKGLNLHENICRTPGGGVKRAHRDANLPESAADSRGLPQR
jgi:hypothetical protein